MLLKLKSGAFIKSETLEEVMQSVSHLIDISVKNPNARIFDGKDYGITISEALRQLAYYCIEPDINEEMSGEAFFKKLPEEARKLLYTLSAELKGDSLYSPIFDHKLDVRNDAMRILIDANLILEPRIVKGEPDLKSPRIVTFESPLDIMHQDTGAYYQNILASEVRKLSENIGNFSSNMIRESQRIIFWQSNCRMPVKTGAFA